MAAGMHYTFEQAQDHLRAELFGILMRRQGHDAIAVGMPAQHRQRAAPDRAR